APRSRFQDDVSRTAAFETVQELKDRLASMAEDLEKVRAKADRLNNDLTIAIKIPDDAVATLLLVLT
ncbi:MAG: hypothetical protein K2Q07_00460, partial [Burkholderiaceae bacterium]|nr:hypothetical protein [Burkholderiaceae bacterium]